MFVDILTVFVLTEINELVCFMLACCDFPGIFQKFLIILH